MISLVTAGRPKEKEYGSHRSADGSSSRSVKGKVKFQNTVKKIIHEKKKVEGKINTINFNNSNNTNTEFNVKMKEPKNTRKDFKNIAVRGF